MNDEYFYYYSSNTIAHGKGLLNEICCKGLQGMNKYYSLRINVLFLVKYFICKLHFSLSNFSGP